MIRFESKRWSLALGLAAGLHVLVAGVCGLFYLKPLQGIGRSRSVPVPIVVQTLLSPAPSVTEPAEQSGAKTAAAPSELKEAAHDKAPAKTVAHKPTVSSSLAPDKKPIEQSTPLRSALEVRSLAPSRAVTPADPKTEVPRQPNTSTTNGKAVPSASATKTAQDLSTGGSVTGSRQDKYHQDEVDQRPVGQYQPEPAYPSRARRLHLSGEVLVRLLVGREGRVRAIKVLAAHPADVFEEAVTSALLRWRFEPGQLGGRTVSTWVDVPVQFELKSP